MKLLRFGTAGIINTGVDWGLYFLMANAIHYGGTAAKLIGSAGGISSAFLFNALWVFGESFRVRYNGFNSSMHKVHFVCAKYLQTIAVYSLGMFVNVTVFNASINRGIGEIPALFIATACSFMINFLLSKNIVFNASFPDQHRGAEAASSQNASVIPAPAK